MFASVFQPPNARKRWSEDCASLCLVLPRRTPCLVCASNMCWNRRSVLIVGMALRVKKAACMTKDYAGTTPGWRQLRCRLAKYPICSFSSSWAVWKLEDEVLVRITMPRLGLSSVPYSFGIPACLFLCPYYVFFFFLTAGITLSHKLDDTINNVETSRR